MEAWNAMSLALEWTLAPARGGPFTAPEQPSDSRLEVSVVFTSVECTIPALKKAAALADRLRARITLLVPQVVPYPIPLASPPILLDFSERRFRIIVAQSPVETRVHVYLCRDRLNALEIMLRPRSLVVVGGRKRWWPTAEKKLARQLRRAGHEVVFTEME